MATLSSCDYFQQIKYFKFAREPKISQSALVCHTNKAVILSYGSTLSVIVFRSVKTCSRSENNGRAQARSQWSCNWLVSSSWRNRSIARSLTGLCSGVIFWLCAGFCLLGSVSAGKNLFKVNNTMLENCSTENVFSDFEQVFVGWDIESYWALDYSQWPKTCSKSGK